MNRKVLNTLEFNKIVEMLMAETTNEMSLRLSEKTFPKFTFDDVLSENEQLKSAIRLIDDNGEPHIRGVCDISLALKRIEKGGILNNRELLNIASSLRVAKNMIAFGKLPSILDEYFGVLEYDSMLYHDIMEAIISEDEISDNASVTLFKIRKQISLAHSRIKEHLNSIIHSASYQKYLQESIITIRDGRYVVPVKAENKSDVMGIVHDISTTGSTLFIEPNSVVNENNKILELQNEEKKEEERILMELTGKVAPFIHNLFVNQKALVELDLIFAKAKLTIKLDGIVPKINNDGIIEIKRGRHPLIDKNKVVPVDVWLGKDFKTLVITGPNTGGKTVTLKTIGLFACMTCSGIGIPASDGSNICVPNNIFVDIGDEQSIEQNLSTFSSHMTNTVSMLKIINKNSLVLFDELGAGTDPTEGAALAISILKYVKDLGAITAATTHYSEIKMYALTNDDVENACCEFDVNSLRPTYNLLIGVPGKSNAFAISKRLGLPEFIIKNAEEYLSDENVKFEDVISDLETEKVMAAKERQDASKYKLEIEKIKLELENEKRKLADSKTKLTDDARTKAKKILEEAKQEADELIEQIKTARNIKNVQESNKAINDAKRKINEKIKQKDKDSILSPKINNDIPKTLIPGNTVEILDINQTGVVISSPKADGTVALQVGIMKINSNIKNLRLISQKDTTKKPLQHNGRGGLKTSTVKSEIDLRGQMLDDALFSVDKYIDDAYIAGLNQITIIHGKGTGVLRKGIHGLLKGHKLVKSYRLGLYGEGESGVTIVEFKK